MNRDAEQGQPAGEKRSDEERGREGARRGERRVSAALLRGALNFFYSLNIGPNQTPSTLRAREYKCSPSRLYNHGSVKLTSQSCNQPPNSDGRKPNPGHRPPLPRVLKFWRCPNLNPYPYARYLRSTKLSSDTEIPQLTKIRANKILFRLSPRPFFRSFKLFGT